MLHSVIPIEDMFLVVGGRLNKGERIVKTERCELKNDKMECNQQLPEFDAYTAYGIHMAPVLFAVKPYFCKYFN